MDVGAVLKAGASADAFRKQDAVPNVPADPAAPEPASAAARSAATPNHPQQTQAPLSVAPRAVIDPQTHTAIIQPPDTYLGGVVVEQAPALALLRQIAYEDAQMRQALIQGKDPNAAIVAAVQKIDSPI